MKLSDFNLQDRPRGTEDLRATIEAFNDNATDYPRDRTVHASFSARASETPDAVAVMHGESNYSYRVVDEASNRFARFLIDRGVGREDFVAVILERSFEMVVAILGILKAGAAYVPIDFDAPFERMKYLLDDTRARVLVSEKNYIRTVNRLQWECAHLDVLFCADSRNVHAEPEGVGGMMKEETWGHVGNTTSDDVSNGGLSIDKRAANPHLQPRHKHQFDLRALENYPATPLDERSGPESLAYTIYTSGTSGQPKGTLVEHRSIVRLVLNTNYIELTAEDRCLQTGSLAFDASTFEIWGMLLNGGGVCRPLERAILDSAEITRLIRKHGITTMWITASLFNQHVDMDLAMFAGLKHLLVGGEKLSVDHVNRVREAYPGLKIINGYGPTENTTFTTCHDITATYASDIPIGKPIANTQVLILDDSDGLAPVGVPGEICAAGDGLARGYLHNAELTQARFTPHPFENGKRIYHTGDLGRWRADGAIEYLGRIDDQVKIRGYRVEPREIETCLLRDPRVTETLVLARDFGGGSLDLVAYVVGDDELDVNSLRDALKSTLPDYMVPAYVVRLDRMPLNANGKVDRRAMPDPVETERPPSIERVPPRTETEKTLVEIWEAVLGHKGIGITDNFFDAGGHSLKVTKVVAMIQERLDVAVPLGALFRAATIRELAAYILDAARYGIDLADEAMVCMGGKTNGPYLFAFPPGTGDAVSFIQLADRLRPYTLYGFNFIQSSKRLEDYADLVASVDPEGPYLFFGYSSGGNLAYHVCQEIERRGLCVSDIVMVDSGRKLECTPFPREEVESIVDEFINHESNRPYLNSPVLRDKARRLIESSYAYIENAVDEDKVNANVHVITSEGAVDENYDANGKLLATRTGWAALSRGELDTYQGEGDHNHMLYQPYLDRNAELIRTILDRAVQQQPSRSEVQTT